MALPELMCRDCAAKKTELFNSVEEINKKIDYHLNEIERLRMMKLLKKRICVTCNKREADHNRFHCERCFKNHITEKQFMEDIRRHI